MKSIYCLFMSIILILMVTSKVYAPVGSPITIKILYDNYVSNEELKTDWGFSCVIEGTEKTVLFDAGTKGDILFHNIKKLKVNLEEVELVAISHHHGDHFGGLFSFLKENNEVTVYLPVSFPDEFFRRVEKNEAKAIAVDKPVEMCKDAFLTGEMGDRIKEQSLILNTAQGLVVITGCAHPGILRIVKRAKEIIDKKIYQVCGGFHLLDKSEAEIKEIINQFKDLGVMKVGATHCTGDRAIELFKEAYGKNFVQMGVGRVIKIAD